MSVAFETTFETTLHNSVDPLTTWRQLRAGNERLTAAARGCGPMVDARPGAAVFRCADAAMASEAVFGQGWGSLIDVSTWGHVVDSGVVATLEYAVADLELPLIVVLGHHDCAAMRAATRAWDEAALPSGGTRTTIEQIFGSIVRRNIGTDSVEDVEIAHITETGLSLLDRSPAIAARVEDGRCGIVCATVNPADGRITTHATVGSVGEPAGNLLECV